LASQTALDTERNKADSSPGLSSRLGQSGDTGAYPVGQKRRGLNRKGRLADPLGQGVFFVEPGPAERTAVDMLRDVCRIPQKVLESFFRQEGSSVSSYEAHVPGIRQ